MDWSNASHLMQALMVAASVLVFLHGFSQGNKQ
jgi:hypothetical protein